MGTFWMLVGVIVGFTYAKLESFSYRDYLFQKIDDYSPVCFKTTGQRKFAYIVSEDKYLELSSNSTKYLNSQLAYKVNHDIK